MEARARGHRAQLGRRVRSRQPRRPQPRHLNADCVSEAEASGGRLDAAGRCSERGCHADAEAAPARRLAEEYGASDDAAEIADDDHAGKAGAADKATK